MEREIMMPLAGIKVLDFSHVFAGPYCARNLADLGADVVHVETHARTDGDSYRAAANLRNKRSITLDLKSEAGHAVATRLATMADIIVENFSSGVMRRLKLDYDTLSPGNPRLIFVSMSGYGHTGPRHAWTSMNTNLQAYTGLMLTTGNEGDPPTLISNSWNDYIGGLHASIAVLQALVDRTESGHGRNIDLAQFEGSVSTLGPLVMASAVSGKAPSRRGNRSTSAAPQGVYPCAGQDEWCAISVETSEQWRGLARAIGQEALAADPRFATTSARLQHQDEIDAAIAAWTRELSPREVEDRLNQAGVPSERMRRAKDFVESPDTGQVYRPVPGDRPQPVLAATLPFRFSKSTIAEVEAPDRLGGHTREALVDWLGMSEAEIDELDGQGALV
jgi:crotonobetainyl-CoA:carnitine CoA-transferase CaiB-like acyl-CoA transferase